MGNYGADIQSVIAAELRAEKGRKGPTYPAIAEKSGLTVVSIRRYIQGERDIPLAALAAICRALDVPMGVIVERAEQALAKQQPEETDPA